MLNKMLIVMAHALTKQLKGEFPEVNYHFQFGICVKYLLENKEERQTIFFERLQGSDKQIKWAKDIRRNTWNNLLFAQNIMNNFTDYNKSESGLRIAKEIAEKIEPLKNVLKSSDAGNIINTFKNICIDNTTFREFLDYNYLTMEEYLKTNIILNTIDYCQDKPTKMGRFVNSKICSKIEEENKRLIFARKDFTSKYCQDLFLDKIKDMEDLNNKENFLVINNVNTIDLYYVFNNNNVFSIHFSMEDNKTIYTIKNGQILHFEAKEISWRNNIEDIQNRIAKNPEYSNLKTYKKIMDIA